MPGPCTCACGFVTDGGELCLDWAAVGMYRRCVIADGAAGAWESRPNWTLLCDEWLAWTNDTCRTHRVVATMDVPWVKMKVGGGNSWYVRAYIDGAINGGPPVDTTREPEMQWSVNWYLALPAGTDQEQTAPGSAEREFIVPPGDSVTVGFRFFGRNTNYNAHAANRLEVADHAVSLSAWPSKVDSGSGRTC